jgi:hypothetical protein
MGRWIWWCLGSGPGGYTAAFRAADLGLKVTLIERWPMLGGVCLNVGCIPSKALLHAAKVIEDAADMAAAGITFAPPQIDREKLRQWKNQVVTKLTNGLTVLAKQRKVDVVHGEAKFVGPNTLEINGPEGLRRSISSNASSRRVRSRCACLVCRMIRASSIPPALWSCRRLQAAAGDRRRHHRLGDGLRVRCARRQGHRG